MGSLNSRATPECSASCGSESKCRRRVQIAYVPRGGCLLEEITREKVEVSSRAREVRSERVLHHNSGLVTHESGGAEVSGANQNRGEIVDPVMNRTAPIERHFRGNRRSRIDRQANRRSQIGQVRGAKQRRESRIHWVREQRIECVDVVARSIGVAARIIETNSKARSKFQPAQRHAVAARNCAGQDVAASESAGLKDKILIVIEAFASIPNPAAKGISDFMTDLTSEGVQLAITPAILASPASGLLRACETRTPLRLSVIGNGERVWSNKDGMRQGRIPGPAAVPEGETKSVEGATNVQALAFPDNMTAAKLNLLAPDAEA